MPTAQYTRWVYRVWDRLAELTGRQPAYHDAESIGSYCPVCREGTIRVHFIERPEPSLRISSNAISGRCSLGCRAQKVFEVLEP